MHWWGAASCEPRDRLELGAEVARGPYGVLLLLAARTHSSSLLQNMAGLMLKGSRRVLTSQHSNSPCLWRSITRRNIASTPTTSGEASSLPLSGIKVLDMTRVLAGVSSEFSQLVDRYSYSCSRTARKYWETLGTQRATLYEPTAKLDVKEPTC